MAPDDTASARSPRWRVVLFAVLVLTTVASAAWLVYALTSRGDAEAAQSRREEVMSVGEQFMLRKETFSPDDLDDQGRLADYSSSVSEVISPKLTPSFEEQTRALEKLVAKNGLASSSRVTATAVTSIDEDSADALVVGETTFQFTNSEPRTAPFRYRLALVKTGGEWLVDAFEDVREDQP
jgi:Mce-associated membrane protein